MIGKNKMKIVSTLLIYFFLVLSFNARGQLLYSSGDKLYMQESNNADPIEIYEGIIHSIEVDDSNEYVYWSDDGSTENYLYRASLYSYEMKE